MTPSKAVAICFLSSAICIQSLTVRLATRASKLAITQAEHACNALQKITRDNVDVEIVRIDASGDTKVQSQNTPTQLLPLALSSVDFTGALDESVLSGTVDAAVHSMKDIPPDCKWDDSLTIGACLGPRAIASDVLITREASMKSIQSLQNGSKIGSASVRRQAQLKAINPSLQPVNVRGNIDTRLNALTNNEVDALVSAMASLDRLKIVGSEANTIHLRGNDDSKLYYHVIPIDDMLPGLCQGIIAVTCRCDNSKVLSILQKLDDHDVRIAASTERAYLNTLQQISPWNGRPPLAGYMRRVSSSQWMFNGLLATPDGSKVLRVERIIINENCNIESAQRLGEDAGLEVLNRAGDSFLDGYYSNL